MLWIMLYHPDSMSAIYFWVTQHNLQRDVIEIAVNSIYHKTPIQQWPHRENETLKKIEKNILGGVPDFESLKTLRTYINKIAKCDQQVKFE